MYSCVQGFWKTLKDCYHKIPTNIFLHLPWNPICSHWSYQRYNFQDTKISLCFICLFISSLLNLLYILLLMCWMLMNLLKYFGDKPWHNIRETASEFLQNVFQCFREFQMKIRWECEKDTQNQYEVHKEII